MRQLTCRVAAKKADARCEVTYRFCEFPSCVRFTCPRVFSVMPILAEQTVKCASFIKHSQIQIAVFCSGLVRPFRVTGASASCTNPVGYTVGRQRVIIPGYYSLFGSTTHQMPIFISSHTAKTLSPGRYLTTVLTKTAPGTSRRRRWQRGKAKFLAACSMNFLKLH